MSSDPPRLLDDGVLTSDERRALEVGAGERSPVGAKAAIWGALSLKLVAPATAAAATAVASAGTTATGATATGAGAAGAGLVTSLALVKSASLGLALGAVVGGGLYFGGRAVTPPAVEHPRVLEGATSVTAPFHTAAAPAWDAPAPPASASAEPPEPSAALEPHAPSAHPERAREAPPIESESQRVARARALLRAGDATRALETLGALERDEPNGLLAQEREALTIEALAAVGRRDAARARADAFLARYPTSPHALAVRRAAGYAP
ncbi:MAG TPA: hypothetical protein VMI54_14770 [Polyangiaceae bacterium]|nr:hypothetical protein [Polyangiaceae bacterium]